MIDIIYLIMKITEVIIFVAQIAQYLSMYYY